MIIYGQNIESDNRMETLEQAGGGYDYEIEQNSFQELVIPLAEMGRHELV